MHLSVLETEHVLIDATCGQRIYRRTRQNHTRIRAGILLPLAFVPQVA